MTTSSNNFRHWNREGRWLDFDWSGLELSPSGALRLHALPLLDPPLSLPAVASPAGAIAAAPGRTVLAASPESGEVISIEPCDGGREPVPLPAGMKPVGLAFSAAHGMWFIADAASNRVRGFSEANWAELLSWAGFDQLRQLAAGGGYVYVAHAGRVDQLSIAGDATSFGDRVAATAKVPAPGAVAIDGDRVFIRDLSGRTVEFTGDGEFQSDVSGASAGRGLAASGGVVYAGEPDSVAVYRRHRVTWTNAGRAAGYAGPVAALACDAHGGLWVHPGRLEPLPRLVIDGGRTREGWLTSQALSTGRTVTWHALEALADLPTGTTLDIAYAIGNAAPSPSQWKEPGQGLTLFLLAGPEAQSLWLRIHVLGDGTATPELRQLRTEYDHAGYLPYLPEIYREPDVVDPLAQFLALFESMFDHTSRSFEELAAWLHPGAAPDAVLGWLESFLGIEGSDRLAPAVRRTRIRAAYASSARRGTPAHLREAIRLEAGVQAVIEEPILQTAWWSLPDAPGDCAPMGGALGIDTVLAGAEPQGAVAGTTAVADRSHLITNEDFGSPLFDDVAHRFQVRLYRAELACDSTLDLVKHVVERDKPAHTLAAYCITEPLMRIGYQATIGVDSVIGGGDPPATRLGEGPLVLAGTPAGRLGDTMTAGVSARL